MKVLIVTSAPVDGELLRGAIGDDADGAVVHVVAPALNESGLAFWVSDSDEAISDAQDVKAQSVEALDESAGDVTGETGEGEPLQAVQDALATFPAERVVIFSRPSDEQKYREDEIAEAEKRFGVPVTHSVLPE